MRHRDLARCDHSVGRVGLSRFSRNATSTAEFDDGGADEVACCGYRDGEVLDDHGDGIG